MSKDNRMSLLMNQITTLWLLTITRRKPVMKI